VISLASFDMARPTRQNGSVADTEATGIAVLTGAAIGRNMTWPFLRLVHPLWAALGRGRKAADAPSVLQPVQLPPTPIAVGKRQFKPNWSTS
jgi:hypothetical protein